VPRPKFAEADLAKFTGTENWYRHSINRNVLFTDGAKYVADNANAYWLLDEIALAQIHQVCVTTEPFQVWNLTVYPNQEALLSCDDGDGRLVFTQRLAWTDFPLEGMTLFFVDGVIYLPSEH
jgi:Family of unknown function (DUF6876)